jgi:hypothetical protein
MKKLIAISISAILVSLACPTLKADNSVLGKGKARDLQKKLEGQGSAGVTKPQTNAPKPKANSAPLKK